MKMRLLLALVGLTIGFVVPVFAQEKEEVNPRILAAIQANDKAYDDAFNKHDAAGIAALFSENAVLVLVFDDVASTGKGKSVGAWSRCTPSSKSSLCRRDHVE
jgi:ketosteroid isomerase-like protein